MRSRRVLSPECHYEQLEPARRKARGPAAGSIVVTDVLDVAPELEFGLAIGILAVLATAVAAIPPAVVAAYRDPVRILRVA